MQKFWCEKNLLFQQNVVASNEALLHDLVKNGQKPRALFIGCSDSRVVPNLLTQSTFGELFVVRNIGNFVPPYESDMHAAGAAIEYGVKVLGVQEIIVCGHTHCGAIAALFEDIDSDRFKHVRGWLELGKDVKEAALQKFQTDRPDDAPLRYSERYSVVQQLNNLMSYPFVKEKVERGELTLHGWIYDIETGALHYWDEDRFVSCGGEHEVR